jgi:hypothetical protein
MMDYYDAVLGLIPLSVGGVSVALLWAGITMSLAVSAGALVAAGLVGHAMFVRTPIRQPGDSDASLASGHADQSNNREYGTAD